MTNFDILSLKDKEKGNRCFILACGPSLLDCSEDQLKGEKKIAVNHAIQRFPSSQYSVIADPKCYNEIGPTNNILFSASYPFRIPNSYYSKDLGNRPGWSWDLTKGVHIGHTSTYMALQLAVWVGFSPIILLGLDLYDTDDRTHYYGKRSPKQQATLSRENLHNAMRESFEWAEENELKGSIEIYNASMTSKMQTYPFVTLSGALKWRQ